MRQNIISPSILSTDFARLCDEIDKVKNAHMLHIDVMDGHFVPNISIGIPVVASIDKYCDMFLDVHLMISNPIDYITEFCDAGADLICFHVEANSNISDTIRKIKSYHKKVGIAIKPKTKTSSILPYIKDIDMVLVMTVEPGFGGQQFMADMLTKITEIRTLAQKFSKEIDIQVDGGINFDTAKLCVDAGANVLVAGSFVFNSENQYETIEKLKSI